MSNSARSEIEQMLEEARTLLTPKSLETYLLMVDAKLQEINSVDSVSMKSEKNTGADPELIRYLKRLLSDMKNRR